MTPEPTHPAILALRAHEYRVQDIGAKLNGCEFAHERGWLSKEELKEFGTLLDEWPWTTGGLLAHEARVRLDHEREFEQWLRFELANARRQKLAGHRWRAIRSRNLVIHWRIDYRIEATPSETMQRSTWIITHVESGTRVLTRTVDANADAPMSAEHPAARIEENTVFVRDGSGLIEELALRAPR